MARTRAPPLPMGGLLQVNFEKSASFYESFESNDGLFTSNHEWFEPNGD